MNAPLAAALLCTASLASAAGPQAPALLIASPSHQGALSRTLVLAFPFKGGRMGPERGRSIQTDFAGPARG